ncbi:MAG: hypothetical protein ACRDWN_06240 [Acidimicrobiales bacterium]
MAGSDFGFNRLLLAGRGCLSNSVQLRPTPSNSVALAAEWLFVRATGARDLAMLDGTLAKMAGPARMVVRGLDTDPPFLVGAGEPPGTGRYRP